ncbi:hypothetical protein D3C72_1956830 [compost metagenome]
MAEGERALLLSACAAMRSYCCCTSTLVMGSELTTATMKSAERGASCVLRELAGALVVAPAASLRRMPPAPLSLACLNPCAEVAVASSARLQAALQVRMRCFMFECINRNC